MMAGAYPKLTLNKAKISSASVPVDEPIEICPMSLSTGIIPIVDSVGKR